MRIFRLQRPIKQDKGYLNGQHIKSISTEKLKNALGRHNLPLNKLREVRTELSSRLMTGAGKPIKKRKSQYREGKLYGCPLSQISTDKLYSALKREADDPVAVQAIGSELKRRELF